MKAHDRTIFYSPKGQDTILLLLLFGFFFGEEGRISMSFAKKNIHVLYCKLYIPWQDGV